MYRKAKSYFEKEKPPYMHRSNVVASGIHENTKVSKLENVTPRKV